jgi:lipid II:glycine glycyltransferase (peptidoglycan interpeptide bridge formation enzyme)
MITISPCRKEDFPAHDNLFQTTFWGEFKRTQAQYPLYFRIETDGLFFPFMVLVRTSSAEITYGYAPKAPFIAIPEGTRGVFLEELSIALHSFLPKKTVCIRYDLIWKEDSPEQAQLRPELKELRMNFGTKTAMLRKSTVDHLCPDTLIINLKHPPKLILAHMRQTTRNSIRHAYRAGVFFSIQSAVEAMSTGMLAKWHTIYKSTALRKQFYFEEYPYFKKLFEYSAHAESDKNFPSFYSAYGSSSHNEQSDDMHDSAPDDMQTAAGALARIQQEHMPRTPSLPNDIPLMPLSASAPPPRFYLCTAQRNGILLSGLVLALCGRTAYYLYSGSSLDGRDMMPNYGLQWEVMIFARTQGATSYDLMGIPPDSRSAHPMSGLFIFKTGFGGDHVTFGGAWDYVFDEETYDTFSQEEQFGTVS